MSENENNYQNSEALTNAAEEPTADGKVEITFDPEGISANMTLHRPTGGGRPITPELVFRELAAKGIKSGIDEMDIKDMVAGKVYELPICIARAQLPKKGRDGSVKYRYEKERLPRPKYDENGDVDFRELNIIIPISKGDFIADIVPPTAGVPGVNIFGKEIPSESGRSAPITLGKNTKITSDGKNIVAISDGHIVYGMGCFNVENTVTIKTDLDLSVGNIDFHGDVVVRGNVLEGFSIKSGGNIRVDGTVFGSHLYAAGNVTIHGGAINAEIECDHEVKVGFCEYTSIKAKGRIESAQFAFCNLFCYGEIVARGMDGVIAGGTVTCMKNITAGIIGSEKYTSTEITIGDDTVTCERKREAEKELAEINEKLAQVTKNANFLKQRKSIQGGQLTDIQSKQLKTETQNKLFLSVKAKELEQLIAQLTLDLRNRDELCAVARGTIYPGSHFCINYFTLDVTEIVNNAKVCIVDDVIQVVPL